MMQTQLIELKLPILPTLLQNRQQIEAEIERYGTLLRWAITQLNRQEQTFRIEAIVLTSC